MVLSLSEAQPHDDGEVGSRRRDLERKAVRAV
jgi:hypothetical protein